MESIRTFRLLRKQLDDQYEIDRRKVVARDDPDATHGLLWEYHRQCTELEGRCFGEPLVTRFGPVDSPARLWAYINLVDLPVCEVFKTAGEDEHTLGEIFTLARKLNLMQLVPPTRKEVRSHEEVLDEIARISSVLENLEPDEIVTEEATLPAIASDATTQIQPVEEFLEPRQFAGGSMVFFEDRVELCGVDICSGARSEPRRRLLDLLRTEKKDGGFESYSAEKIVEQLELQEEGTVTGAIRDLRGVISKRLHERANIICGREDVVLNRGHGYRLSESITILDEEVMEAAATNLRGHGTTMGGANVSNVTNAELGNVSDVSGPIVSNVSNLASVARRQWILQRLEAGERISSITVAKHFNCSNRTAFRDLKELQDSGQIEFFGAARTGFYRRK